MDVFGLSCSSVGLVVVNNLLFSKGLVIIQGFMKPSSFYCNIYKADSRIPINANENFNTGSYASSILIVSIIY